MIEVALSTGMRSGEILALRYGPDSLDLDRGVIVIGPKGNLSRLRDEHGRFPLDLPKTPASERTLTLTPSLVQVLREHRLATGHPGDGAFVFADDRGNPLDGTTAFYRDCWLAALADASIPNPRPRLHEVRHHWTTVMQRAGNPDQVVMEAAGWESMAMIQGRYGKHTLPGEHEAAAIRLDEYLRVAAQA